jgi:RecG-like helicase
LRGMGKISGVEQSGFWDLKIADPADLEAIKMARAEAEKLLQSDPLLENLPELKKTLSTSEQVAHLE